ncbi:MAG: hypothetical protein ACXVB9_17140 [Bdellovibrionota bacterium]
MAGIYLMYVAAKIEILEARPFDYGRFCLGDHTGQHSIPGFQALAGKLDSFVARYIFDKSG